MTETTSFTITIEPRAVKRIGLVGTGLIGSAWAAHFLARGLDVIAYDPDPNAEGKLRAWVNKAWPSLEQLGLATGASQDRLHFTTKINDALKDADFIQESTPENHEIKDKVMAAISAAARPDRVIASSTSGIIPTRLQAQCQHPQRMLVGHPFNPVHLIPLVEVVGGQHTAPDALRWTMGFYRHWGKTPLHCRAEVPGHLGNRLQAAVGNEARQLVAEGLATTGDIDTALTAGPGLRWALLGYFMIGHLAAGEGGLRDTLMGKFDAESAANENSNLELIERMITGNQSQVAGRSLTEIEQMRDEFLVGLLKVRADIERKYGFDAGSFTGD